ncbi:MAG: hypothetical protein Q9186_007322 [Xanthomendoza sp. 1 TL-2023]
MASHTLPRPILRLPFRTHHIRPFSTTQPHHLPEPQSPSSFNRLPPTPQLSKTPPPNPSTTPQPPARTDPLKTLLSSIQRDANAQSRATGARRTALADTTANYRATDLERHLYRRFRPGDIYAPHDLSPVEQHKWRQRYTPSRNMKNKQVTASRRRSGGPDVFDALGIHPLEEYKNFSIMTEFVTGMGRIKHRRETGLSGVNQRRVARAVRRAVGMGLMPSVHKHPEVLEKEAEDMARRRAGRMMGQRERFVGR